MDGDSDDNISSSFNPNEKGYVELGKRYSDAIKNKGINKTAQQALFLGDVFLHDL